MTVYISLIIAIVAFSLIVVVHEAGHCIAAKKNGIFVEEFAIGMGPKLVSKKFGETVYSIRAFPVGGFCKMLGEDAESNDPRAFNKKSVMARIVVIVAGAFMNFVFGFVLIFVLMLISGYSTTVVGEAVKGAPAYEAGIKSGDRITAINGRGTYVFDDLLFAMNFSGGRQVAVDVISDGKKKTLNIMPYTETTEYGGKTYSSHKIGVSPKSYAPVFGKEIEGVERATIAGSFKNTFNEFGFYVRVTYESLYMLITSQISPSELSGFVGIGGAFVDSIEAPINYTDGSGVQSPLSVRVLAALTNVLTITILITINLGIMNLLPFPALDGGRTVFLIVEGIRRKPVDPDKEGIIHFAGLVLLMALMVFVTYNDITKIFINNG